MKAVHLRTLFATLAAIGAMALAWNAWQWQAARDAQAVVQAAFGAPVPEGAASAAGQRNGDARVLIVQASALRAQGRHDDAVRILQALAARGDLGAASAQVVRFNLGNELIALALQHNTKGDEDRAMTLVELAKQRYREVLRSQPQHWDARHNLDIALRLVPETEPPSPDEKPTNIQRIQVDLRGIRGVDLP
jgi:mxaK protein